MIFVCSFHIETFDLKEEGGDDELFKTICFVCQENILYALNERSAKWIHVPSDPGRRGGWAPSSAAGRRWPSGRRSTKGCRLQPDSRCDTAGEKTSKNQKKYFFYNLDLLLCMLFDVMLVKYLWKYKKIWIKMQVWNNFLLLCLQSVDQRFRLKFTVKRQKTSWVQGGFSCFGHSLTLAQQRKASTSGTSLGSSLAKAAKWLVVRQAMPLPALTLHGRPLRRDTEQRNQQEVRLELMTGHSLNQTQFSQSLPYFIRGFSFYNIKLQGSPNNSGECKLKKDGCSFINPLK